MSQQSVPTLTTAITAALRPAWTVLQGFLLQLVGLIKIRGVMEVSNLTALAQLSGADSTLVWVKSKGLYKYNPNGSGTLPDTWVRANAGGAWELVSCMPAAPYRRVIGDGTATSFTITHNLDCLYPTVEVWETLNNVDGFPATQLAVVTNYTVSHTSRNACTITTVGSTWGGSSKTVVVKPY